MKVWIHNEEERNDINEEERKITNGTVKITKITLKAQEF